MLFRLLRTYLVRYRLQMALLVIFQAIQAVATLFLPDITANIIDHGILGNDNGYIWTHGGVMLAVTIAQMIANAIAIYFAATVAMAFGRDLRDAQFEQVMSYSTREVASIGPPSLITRTTNDVQQVQQFVLMSFTLFVAAPIMAVGGVVMALRQDVGLSWVLTGSIPLLIISVGWVAWRMIPQFRRMQEKVDRINQVLREQITGIRVVRAFVRERAERRRFEEVNAELTDTGIRAGYLQALIFPFVTTVMNGSSIVVLWLGASRITDGTLQIGSLIAFLTYLIQILMAVMMGVFIAILAPRATVCAERIAEVLETQTSITPSAAPTALVADTGRVTFDSVTFGYPGADEPVLHDISLTVERGTTCAIIGSTGSGKTTLMHLIPRLLDVTGGTLSVDGTDIRDIEAEVLWQRIGLVPQRPYLFSGTVASNLRFSKPDATDEELWEALQVAQGAEFVAAMAGGLAAEITQGGTNVSGGQRQRLAIARALIRRPSVLLFDDSFSALDLATEARLRAALAPRTTDTTVFVVGQRISSIRDAEQILVLEDGRAVGLGTHDELLEGCATYREIVDSQLRSEDAA
ncbi:MAG TPA: ABC transporter ATP-binding protein [Acidimicrobiales bacterium]|nr:ABC transporter ATP-binding protein [Acidimicrobiales bacterium]